MAAHRSSREAGCLLAAAALTAVAFASGHGFGLPAAHLGARLEAVSEPERALRYTIETRGWLTDVDGFARFTVPGAAFERIRVRVGRGDIRVVDATRAGVARAGMVQLELSTGGGTVQR